MDRLGNIPGGMLIAFVIGVIDALIIWAISNLFDVSIQVPDSPGSDKLTDLTLLPILGAVAVASIAAGLLLWGLQRFAPDQALLAFQTMALIALGVSMLLPFTLDQAIEGKLALLAMILLAGSAIIAVFTWVGTKPKHLAAERPVED